MGYNDNETDALRRMAGLATLMTLRVAVTLGLPDRLLGDGAAADQLAAELNVSPVTLGILLDHLTTLGVVEPTSTGYRTTEFGANLCADAGNGFTNMLLHLDSAAGRAELAFVELAYSIATGRAAYPRRYGQDFWADLAESPYLRESFETASPYPTVHANRRAPESISASPRMFADIGHILQTASCEFLDRSDRRSVTVTLWNSPTRRAQHP
ncbi:hypothetical protein AB0M45_26910 [Nocardia sp. NPDC051787]|uniref:methyltransferase family protein n=1 Tax=Nocardia sp. NPDC051787 TaxID=3155415 RepID=UPI003445B02C